MNVFSSLRKKHMILLLCALAIICPSLAQKRLIGVPLFDKHLNQGICNLCINQDAETAEQVRIFRENNPNQGFKNYEDLDSEALIQSLRYVESQINQTGNTIQTKAFMMREKAIILSTTLDYHDSDFIKKRPYLKDNRIPEIKPILTIHNLFDTLLAMDLDASTKQYLRKDRMLIFEDVGLLSIFEIWEPNFFQNKDTNNFENTEYKKMAAIYLEDERLTNFIPFKAYSGLNFGLSGYMGKYNLFGAEVAYEFVMNRNPFANLTRFDLLGLLYHVEPNGMRKEFLFNVFHLKKIGFVSMNLLQFGLQSGLTNDWNWCYRPQTGYAFGPFQIAYSYNFTFNAEARKNANGHLFTFNFSYPLIRIGKYE